MNRAIVICALMLSGCGSGSSPVRYRVVEKFTTESLNPHSLGSKMPFLEIDGTNFFRLARGGTNSVQAISGGSEIVFFEMSETWDLTLHRMNLTNALHIAIPIIGFSGVGDQFGLPEAMRGSSLIKVSQTNLVFQCFGLDHKYIYTFDMNTRTYAVTHAKSASKTSEQ